MIQFNQIQLTSQIPRRHVDNTKMLNTSYTKIRITDS